MSQILCSITHVRPEEKEIFEAFQKRQIPCQIIKKKDYGSYLHNSRSVVLVRNSSHQESLETAKLFHCLGIKTVNSPESIALCINKGLQSLAFRKAEIPTPDFTLAFTPDAVWASGKELGYSYVIKPISESWGRGICKIANNDCLRSWLAARESLDAAGQEFPVLLQRYISTGNSDIRMVIVGSKPVLAYLRVIPPDQENQEFRTNVHLGATIQRIPISPGMSRIAENLVKLIGEGIYGVQEVSTNNLYVCEVNHAPEFANSARKLQFDLAGTIADYITTLMEH